MILRLLLTNSDPQRSASSTQTLRHHTFKNAPFQVTDDENFIIDRHPKYENVIIAGGMSGTGFKFAPTIGDIVKNLVLGRPVGFDLSAFRLNRKIVGACKLWMGLSSPKRIFPINNCQQRFSIYWAKDGELLAINIVHFHFKTSHFNECVIFYGKWYILNYGSQEEGAKILPLISSHSIAYTKQMFYSLINVLPLIH